jgi:hypothetical protein
MRLNSNLLKRFNLICPVQSRFEKYSALIGRRSVASSALFRLARGALRHRHERWAGNAMDVSALRGERRVKRTAKSCGPDAPTLASSVRKMLRRRRWQQSPVTGESTKETVKTIAQGRPDCSGEPVVTMLVCFYFCTRGCGCGRASGFPCALCFEKGLVFLHNPGASRRGKGNPCLSCAGAWSPVLIESKRGSRFLI